MTQGSPTTSTPAHLTADRPNPRPGPLWTFRVAATLELGALLAQAVTAGGILGGVRQEAVLHGPGSTFVHVFGLATVVAGVLIRRPGRGPLWPTLAALAVLLVGFVQSMLGGSGDLALHVPMGVALTALATWLTAWSWTRRPTA